MGLLSKIFGRKRGVPDWASVFSEAEYQTFVERLSGALAARSLRTDVRTGTIALTKAGEPARIGFGTLARRCKVLPPEAWDREIAEYLDVAMTDTREITHAFAGDFSAARGKLKIQLVPEGYVRPGWVEGLNYVDFGSGVKAALVYDLPMMVTTVPPEHPRVWQRPWSELFEIAGSNVRAEVGDIVPETVDVGGAVLRQLVGDSYFICSYALWLETIAGARSDRGSIVSVPSPHTVLYHPIRDASAREALASLPAMARELAGQLTGPITTNLFWIKDGRVVDVPVEEAGGELRVRAPAELVEAMEGVDA